MSRGFVKEGDQEETPIIPPRAALPNNAVNYVTPKGLELLKLEREQLEMQRDGLESINEQQRRVDLGVLQGKMDLLNERIRTARVLQLKEQPQDEVRFGATVSYRILPSNNVQQFQIVGVDEADIRKKKIAFVAPIAVALTGHKTGEKFLFQLGSETKEIEVLKIEY
ncbi:GreA/GreB family elongation factor [Aequorivita echinoideorum]|uniref:GreA/GreB family elongation factor n=1 Tax=Aequorivita echinoideorum TaxID=1549647 RepID=A0ABS5S8S8_9FLAO|nr:GreA/GreB family elongation factor [Aequorivita echinoideorum]MBT0608819.1 GreA/GreB family elongation factor [Aequorivita echinoideorum]